MDNQNSSLKQQAYSEVLTKIAQVTPIYLITTALIVLTCAYLFRETVPAQALTGWVAVMFFALLLLGLTDWSFKKYHHLYSSELWGELFFCAMFFIGVGCGSLVFLVPDDITSMLIVAIMYTGLIGGALGGTGSSFQLFSAFAVPVITMAIVRFLQVDSEIFYSFSFAAVVYLGATLMIARNYANTVTEAFFLQLKNTELMQTVVIEKEAAEKANTEKSRFLASASHDLRQPMHAMDLFADALERRLKDPENVILMSKIRDSVSAVSSLLNSLLDISKLDAGVVRVDKRSFSLLPLFLRLEKDFQSSTEGTGLMFSVSTMPKQHSSQEENRKHNESCMIKSDSILLENILRNLLSNALKYTEAGSISLGCVRQGEYYAITVEDTGMGIASDEQEKVFAEFYQVDNPERDQGKGIGLGLTIVRHLCQLLGHQMSMVSTLGEGTRFDIYVPVSKAVERTNTMPIINDGQMNVTVLVIDDEQLILDGMTAMLTPWGCRVLVCQSADEALTRIEATPAIDMVITDYRLREDKLGSDAIQMIRETLNNPLLPAIIISGDTEPKRMQEMKESGVQTLHKPVKPVRMRALMQYVLKPGDSS